MLKQFFIRKIMEWQMKDLPKDQREKIMAMVDKNPQLFEQIAKEAQEKIKNGMDQTTAMISVMQKHQVELKKLMEEVY